MTRTDDTREIVIAGIGGQAKVVQEACRAAGVAVAGFLTLDGRSASGVPGPLLGDETLLADGEFLSSYRIVAATGDGVVRRRIAGIVLDRGTLATVRHPSCIVASSARIGAGTMLAAGAIVGPDIWIGRFCIVNTAASVDHDDVLEDGVNICPGVHLAGAVTCREDAFVGIGASVIQGVVIGRRAVVGAGAAVIRDVPDDTTVLGVPARSR